ncbi:hypothetical protein NW768_011513 [Fusarium equiseti]|uniref:BTB domain-containing protein n=1 Tax=Fusarium equiseti TaxID=61235 RepID=A0ABQ8QX85_FUSEQ|nr:hypothetical protein NW768_011513 [Fusarium equiseti]
MAPHEFLSSILVSGQFSDFTLVCEGQEFRLHQAVVCPQSCVFDAALCGRFEEATTKIITVKEFDLATVKRLVSFFYTGDYDGEPPEESAQDEDAIVTDADADADADADNEQNDPQGSGDEAGGDSDLRKALDEATNRYTLMLLSHLKVNAIADYYDIPGLRDLAESKLRNILKVIETVLPRLLQEVSSSGAHANLNSLIAKAVAEADDASQLLKQNNNWLKLDPELYTEIIVACSREMGILRKELRLSKERYGKEIACRAAITKAMEICIAKLNGTQKCRHCDEKFSCFIEAENVVLGSSQCTFMLRCKSCRTRHP